MERDCGHAGVFGSGKRYRSAGVRKDDGDDDAVCTGTIFILMLLYTLLMVSVMLAVNIRKGQFWGVVSVFIFSLYGLLLNPQIFKQIFNLPDQLMYKANVAVGWLSPLNQATYHMHNFGYDLLPRLWQTYVIFGAVIVAVLYTALRGMRKYNFNFTGSSA